MTQTATPPRRGTRASLTARTRTLHERGVDVYADFDRFGFVQFQNAENRRIARTGYSGNLTPDAAETWLDGFEAGWKHHA